MTMDSTLVQDNNSLLYFRNMQGPRDSSNNEYYALQAAIGTDPGLRLNKYTSTGTLIGTGYLYDTLFNSPYVAVQFFSSLVVLGNNVLPRSLLLISSTSSLLNVVNDADNGISYTFVDNTNSFNGNDFHFYKMRNSFASQSGDNILDLSFYGRNTLNTDVLAASMYVQQDSAAGPGSVSGRFVFNTKTTGGSLTEKLRIDNNNTYIKGDTVAVDSNPFGGNGDNGQLIINSIVSPVTRLGLGVDTVNDICVLQAVNSVTNNGKSLILNPSGGFVGVGTKTPISDLHISDVSNANVTVTFGQNQDVGTAVDTTTYGLERSRNTLQFTSYRDNTANRIGAKIVAINKQTYIDSANRQLIQSADLAFFTVPPDTFIADGTLERVRITDTGNVGIGTQTPTTKLDINGSEIIRNGENNGFSNSLGFYKNRAGTQTLVNDELGYVSFIGKDVTNTDRRAGYIIGTQGGPSGLAYVPGKISHIVTDTTGVERSLLEVNSSKQVVLPNSENNITGSNLNFNKSRSNATTSNLDTLGQVVFNGVDTGNVVRRAAYIQGTQDGVAGATFVPGKISFFTTDSAGGSAERFSVESAGVRITSLVKEIGLPPATAADWIPYYNAVIFPNNTYTYTLSVASPAPDGTTFTFRNALGVGSIVINATNPATVTIPVGATAKFIYISNTTVPFIGAAIGWYQIQ